MRLPQVLIVVAVGVALAGTAAGQSLADAAKKAREQSEKSSEQPSKVYTEKDLKDVSWQIVTPVDTDATIETPADVQAPPASEAGSILTANGNVENSPVTPTVRDEQYWKTRMRAAVAALDDARTKRIATAAQVAELQIRLDHAPTRGAAIIIEDNLLEARRELTRIEAEQVNALRAISDLEEEARRAGVPPGWLRP